MSMDAYLFKTDEIYTKVDQDMPPMVQEIWTDKYRQNGEDWLGMAHRVCTGVYAKDPSGHLPAAIAAMEARLWMPAGRILAGAGTEKRVTLMNCFVNGEITDSMESISDAHRNILLTQQQGGGIGTDFSPIRPAKAWLFRTAAPASGPGPFIDMWDAGCATIKSAGDRRGAMMTTLMCTHPFLPEFITAKHKQGRWTNTNISVLITDAFMAAVAEDEEWYLHHKAQPDIRHERPPELSSLDFEDDDGVLQYVYSVHKARDLWRDILLSTYEYAEPGVIFIDRVNDLNNLNYCEHIQCTNPCGEQPLPYHGCCNLGAANITRMVAYPFSADATFDFKLLGQIVALGVRFLDNVIDVTNYPLPEQEAEELAKRRIGVGMSGLCDAMHFLGMRYGSPQSIAFTEKVARTIANEAYRASALLAKEKGPFPLYDAEKYLAQPFIKNLDPDVQELIRKHGVRNGVILTIAPTGTTSIAYGNGSSGLEPVFLHSSNRKVLQADNTWKEYTEWGYGARVWQRMHQGELIQDELPRYMNVCEDVKIHEHVQIQAVCQKWVDASISKTINLPKEITFDEFVTVYDLAYTSGLKGCTTYRPSDVRGSILSAPDAEKPKGVEGTSKPTVRPEVIESKTVKIRWPQMKSAIYMTVGYVDGEPYEVFFNSKDQSAMEWMTTTTLLMTLCLRKGIPFSDLSEEFRQITSLEGAWVDGHYQPSLISYLGQKIKSLIEPEPELEVAEASILTEVSARVASDSVVVANLPAARPQQCPQCHSYNVVTTGGCPTCQQCGYSKCS